MTLRIVTYWQTPVPPDFARYMIEGTGLSERDQGLAWELRRTTGDTQLYASKAKMPVRQYNEVIAGINRHAVRELIRLAVIGWMTEQKR